MKKLFQVGLICLMVMALVATNAFAKDRYHTYKRVTELNTLSAAASGDWFIIHDTSTGEVKKIDAGDPAVAGNLIFQTTIFASGHDNGATTMASQASNIDAAHVAFGLVQKTMDDPSDQTHTIADGVPGQEITLTLIAKAAGNWVISEGGAASGAITNTGWASITLDTALDSITLLWLDDTRGWIITGNNGCTIA